ncbi:MAG: glycosyltransferase family 2 protein [Gammaproteobacteria bacterium]|nr:glycosyltransferase family 2 protein [Gammaproteobacteria bacterium]
MTSLPLQFANHLYPKEPVCLNPFVTILIPALNEEVTIGEFVKWCYQGLKEAGVEGQVLIVDSSSDRTAEIALAQGGEVLKVPKRGLGRAYIDAIPYVRSSFVIMGDADLTYDFRDISLFIKHFRQGYEYIMGSRFKGTIETGAMPALHRYVGNPLTTWMLNKIYGTSFSDIHCGMRGLTVDALKRMNLQSQSWQYATEMIIKAVQLKLKSTEVPIHFYKDRKGRQSHHIRTGWYSPWVAGLMTMKTIFALRKNI